MVWYIYKYWFKMLKRWKCPPLIKARASSTNCTLGNLTCPRPTQHTCIQSMLNLARFISFLLYKSLFSHTIPSTSTRDESFPRIHRFLCWLGHFWGLCKSFEKIFKRKEGAALMTSIQFSETTLKHACRYILCGRISVLNGKLPAMNVRILLKVCLFGLFNIGKILLLEILNHTFSICLYPQLFVRGLMPIVVCACLHILVSNILSYHVSLCF